MFFSDIFRSLFFMIDSAIHWLIVQLYNIFELLALENIFTNSDLEAFATRIYAFVGVFMLFRIIFSMITYLVNPDQLSDKNQGAGKLMINVVVVLALILLVPTIFQWSMNLQKLILENHTVEKLILGIDDTASGSKENGGKMISWIVFSTFFKPNEDVPAVNYTKYTNDAAPNFDMTVLNDDDVYNKKYDKGNSNRVYVYDYKPIISTVLAGFTAYMLLTYCVQIALRTVKLGFLQLIAPIPIMSYIDPKASKGGAFSSWLKMCISTYLDLFLRLATLFFVIFIIGRLETNIQAIDNAFVKVFLLLGALLFANQAPKLISDMFGMKGSGGDTSKSIKGMLKTGLGIGAAGIATAGAMTLGAGVNAINSFGKITAASGFRGKTGAVLSTIGSTLAGGLSSGTRTLMNYDKKGGMGQNLMRGFQGNVASRDNRQLRHDAGYSGVSYAMDNVKSS